MTPEPDMLARTTSGELIDSFNHLPEISVSVLPPVQIRILDPDFRTLPKELSRFTKARHPIDSNLLAVEWFLNICAAYSEFCEVGFIQDHFVTQSDQGEPYLVTQALRFYVHLWLEGIDNDPLPERPSLLGALLGALDLREIVHNKLDDDHRLLIRLTQEFMSTHVTQVAINLAASNVLPSSLIPPFLSTRLNWAQEILDIFEGRFQKSGKCPYTLSRLYDVYDVEVLFYMSQMSSCQDDQDHSHCTLQECFGNSITPDTYVQHHTSLGCQCDEVSVNTDDLKVILDEPGQIPVICFDDEADNLQFSIKSNIEVPTYVAISYVSSHGLASPHSNSIPACQLSKLRDYLQTIRGDAEGIYGLWIDTLLVPADGTDLQLRSTAMLRMQQTYRDAALVLLIDAYLREWNKPTGPEEFLAQFILSSWFTRLWTLSEASLAKWIWVAYKDGYQSVDMWLSDNPHPDQFGIYEKSKNISITWSLPYSTIQDLRALMRMKREIPGDKIPADRLQAMTLDALIASARNRQTSQPRDEAFCLSMIMGFNTEDIMTVADSDRMITFYSQLKSVSGVLMLQSGSRFKQPGLRWAPTSFLGRKEILRYSHAFDHSIRKEVWGMRVPRGYLAFKLIPIAADVQDTPPREPSAGDVDTPSSNPATRRIYFRIPGHSLENLKERDDLGKDAVHLIEVSMPVDPDRVVGSDAPKEFDLPSGGLVMVVRGWGGQGGHGPCAILEPIRPPPDFIAPMMENMSITETVDDDTQQTVYKQLFTSYYEFGMYCNLYDPNDIGSETDMNTVLNAAFDGENPWDEERVVCIAEEIDLQQTDIWVS